MKQRLSPIQINVKTSPHIQVEIGSLNIIQVLSNDEKKRKIILLDVEVDTVDLYNLRFDLNVIFQTIKIKSLNLDGSYFQIGTTGGEISLSFKKGKLRDYTRGEDIKVGYEKGISKKRCRGPEVFPH